MRFGPPAPLLSHMMMMGAGPSNGGGSGVPAPVNTVAPTVQLDDPPGRVGTTASVADNGTWTNSPDSYGFQWKRNSDVIDGATSNTYTLTEADADQAIYCVVTATNAGGSTSEPSSNNVTPDELRVPQENVPAVIWQESASSPLTIVSAATWQNANPPTLIGSPSYVWQVSPDDVSWSDVAPPETGSSYNPGVALGFYYRLAVTVANSQGNSQPSYSNSVQYTE